jgi:CPA2 family monovalent cation:H+ antiporter-2
MLEIARMLKPDIDSVVRAHSDEEAALLQADGAGQVFMGEHELALGMTRHILDQVGGTADMTSEG